MRDVYPPFAGGCGSGKNGAEGATLSHHFDVLMALAKKMKIVITDKDIYREIVSGDTISARPEMQRLLRAVEAGAYGAILCMDVDRLARGDNRSGHHHADDCI